MPELPEVELVKLQLQSFLVGHKILGVQINSPRNFEGDKSKVLNSKVTGIRRFAKVLAIDLSNGYSLFVHIKLTGQLIYRGPKLRQTPTLSKKVVGGIPGTHTLVIFELDRNGVLYYNDMRRFGWIKIARSDNLGEIDLLRKLGPEPRVTKGYFGQVFLTLKTFAHILSGTRRAIKVVLMDQSRIAGIGNIYANDALWLAKIHPAKPSNALSASEISRLYKAIEKVLEKGLKTGGASELSFVTPDGREGGYQKHFLAYGKEGQLCPRCKKDKFVKTRISGRGTVHCPNCQKLSL